jgi:HlyD family secretion protein
MRLPSVSRSSVLLALALACCGTAEEARVARVTRGDLIVTVEATGALRAVDSSAVSPPVLPEVWEYKIAWLAPESSEVKKGQPILRLDPSELEQQLEKKRAESESAAKEKEKKEVDLQIQLLELDLKLAEAGAALRRAGLKAQVPDQQASRIATEQARLDQELAEAEVQSLKQRRSFLERSGRSSVETLRQKSERAGGRVRELEENIGKLNVLAPRDGLVLYRADWRGQKSKVGDTVSPWQRILEIPDLSRMEAEAEIDEADAGRVALGQRAALRLESHPEIEYAARVTEIAPIVRRQSPRSPLKVYTIKLALETTDTDRMRPGMRLRADIEVDRRKAVLLVPLEAVVSGPEGPSVLVQDGRGGRPQKVRLGARNRSQAELIEGLEEDQPVLLEAP